MRSAPDLQLLERLELGRDRLRLPPVRRWATTAGASVVVRKNVTAKTESTAAANCATAIELSATVTNGALT